MMNRREHAEFSAHAALKGIKIPPLPEERQKVEPPDPKQAEAMDRAMKAAMERKRQEFERVR